MDQSLPGSLDVWEPCLGGIFEPPERWSIIQDLGEGDSESLFVVLLRLLNDPDSGLLTEMNYFDRLSYFWYGHKPHTESPQFWQIMTTPNTNQIPGPYRRFHDISLCQDGFLGHDNPLFWPQLYCKQLPHLACISLRSAPGSDGEFLRRGLTSNNIKFTAPVTAYPHRCRLSPPHVSWCSAIADCYKSAYLSFLNQSDHQGYGCLEVITSQLGLAFGSICGVDCSFLELQFQFALLCHFVLEFDVYVVYHHLGDSREFSMTINPVDNSYMGTVTMEDAICHRFHRMSVPVWLDCVLRPNPGTNYCLATNRLPISPDS